LELLEQLEHGVSDGHEHGDATTVSTTGCTSTGRYTVEGAYDVVMTAVGLVCGHVEHELVAAGTYEVCTTGCCSGAYDVRYGVYAAV
jgi:hypothetical protein